MAVYGEWSTGECCSTPQVRRIRGSARVHSIRNVIWPSRSANSLAWGAGGEIGRASGRERGGTCGAGDGRKKRPERSKRGDRIQDNVGAKIVPERQQALN